MIGRVAAPAAAKAVMSAPVQAIWGAKRGVVYVDGIGSGLNTAVLLEAKKYGVRREVVAWAKAHPTIVPYINQDKDMIHSIADTGWTRSVYGNGESYAVTSLIPTNTSYFKVRYKLKTKNRDYPFVFGCENNGRDKRFGVWCNGSVIAIRATSISQNISNICVGSWRTVGYNAGVAKIDGSQVASGTQNTATGFPVSLFAMNCAGYFMADGGPMDGYMEYFDMDNHLFIPCLYNGNMELLDVVTGTFAERHGTFTQSLEPDAQA